MSEHAHVAVFLALGSNLGDRLANLQAAVELLQQRAVDVLRTSSVWETAPVPGDQPPFLNAVIRGSTHLAPADLLAVAKAIEHDLGRRPSRRWGPRPIDIDILFYDELEMDTPSLTIPHPRIAERGFVLAPLAEVVQGGLPVLGQGALELLGHVDQQGLYRTSLALIPRAQGA